MNYILLLLAVVILCSVFLHRISSKMGIPLLLVFIVLGMLFGSDGVLSIPFENFDFSEKICSTALVVIMFYGGFGTKWDSAKPVAKQAIVLSSLGVILTAFVVGIFCHFVLQLEFLESLLIGAVISSTDAASVFSILRSKQLNLKENTASLLEVESGSNDPCAYMLTMIVLSMMEGKAKPLDIAYDIFAQIFFGIAVGVILALFSRRFMEKFAFEISGFDTAFVLAIAFLSYALSNILGGNGYLSTYMTGIMMGNHWIPNKKALVHFFDGLTSIMQMLIFFLLGLLAFPSKLPHIFSTAIIIMIFLTFVARPLIIFLLLKPFKSSMNQKILVSFSGLRGAASIVFAIMATIHQASFNYDLFHIIFCIVLFSIGFQGSLIPYIAKKLNMIDNSCNVLKTFNDYSEEASLNFIEMYIDEEHEWIGKNVSSLSLPSSMLIVMIARNNSIITPNGNTIIEKDDQLVLCGSAYEHSGTTLLKESNINHGDPRIGHSLEELKGSIPRLIVLIKRNESFFIPDGKTILQQDDILVYQ